MPTLTLSSQQQQAARDRAVQAARLCYAHHPEIHYTQGSLRWQGIDNRLDASKGQYPTYADCSSFATYCIWNALVLPYGLEDVVNGAAWRAGYTGTMLQHGRAIGNAADLLPGDCIIYGPGTGEHTAIVVTGGSSATVISHGSESGPHLLAYNYRSGIQSMRRYIDGAPHQATGGSAPAPPIPKPPEDTVAICVGTLKDGRFEVFVEAAKGEVFHAYQDKNAPGWAKNPKGGYWFSLGTPGK